MSTEVFPLNIGYISAYCEKLFVSKVEITLFKYIEDLEKSLYENKFVGWFIKPKIKKRIIVYWTV